jgi:NAD(P)-dependent dehydrogenase (short-subunit alcohol dehydrogenase family)
MAIVFITGSMDGLGKAAAQSLLDQGRRVVLHARPTDRAASLGDIGPLTVEAIA